MKRVAYTQSVRLYVEVPDDLPLTSEAMREYMDTHYAWPNIIDGDWFDDIEEIEELKGTP